MTKRLSVVVLCMAVWLIGLASLLFAIDVGKIRAIPGAELIQEVALCRADDCAAPTPTTLPYFAPRRFEATFETRHLRATLNPGASTGTLPALYFPKINDTLDVRIDGQLIFANPKGTRLWNMPVLIPVAPALLRGGPVEVAITLSGPPSEGIELQPFYFGPQSVLTPHHAWRSFLGPGLARFGLGLMVVLASALLVVWSFRRQDVEYLWLGLACATVTVTLAHFGYGTKFGAYRLSTMLWALEPSLYVLLLVKFMRRFMDLALQRLEWLHAGMLALVCAAVLLSPPGYAYAIAMWGNVGVTAPFSFCALVIFWMNRNRLTALDLRVFFPCLSIATALGLYELYLALSDAPARTMHLFQFMPLVMSLACIWLILSRLIASLGNYETLTETLHDTVAQKSAELEASFAELGDIKRREAIAEERDRIMLDLHDGIGGQLVSTLAYMHNNDVGDDKVRRALEDALRDLALMLDSMENHDSLVTLLGMMRTRLEGLLSEHGIEFDWQVHGEPMLPNPGPSQSLHLARIVQEAITNVIKHARADTITIFVDEAQIRISDNGKGFDLSKQSAREHPSNGIANMKRRSETIGAAFDLTSTDIGTDTGTRISLRLT